MSNQTTKKVFSTCPEFYTLLAAKRLTNVVQVYDFEIDAPILVGDVEVLE